MKKNKVVLQYDLEGNFLKEWESYTLVDIGSELEINSTNICAAINGRNLTAGNFQWRYKDGSRVQQRIGEVYHLDGSKLKIKVAKYFNNRLISIYNSIEEAAEKNNLHMPNVHQAVYSDTRTCGGFTFKVIE